MNNIIITRGEDVALYIGGFRIEGATSVSVTEKRKYHDVQECMSPDPVERVPQGKVYVIRLTAISLFDSGIPAQDRFNLSIRNDEGHYDFGNCRIVTDKCYISGGKPAQTVFIIESDEMTYLEAEDE